LSSFVGRLEEQPAQVQFKPSKFYVGTVQGTAVTDGDVLSIFGVLD